MQTLIKLFKECKDTVLGHYYEHSLSEIEEYPFSKIEKAIIKGDAGKACSYIDDLKVCSSIGGGKECEYKHDIMNTLIKNASGFSSKDINNIIDAVCKKGDRDKVEIYEYYYTGLVGHIIYTQNVSLLDKIDFDATEYSSVYIAMVTRAVFWSRNKEILYPILNHINKKAGTASWNNKQVLEVIMPYDYTNMAALEWVLQFPDIQTFAEDMLLLKSMQLVNRWYRWREYRDWNILEFAETHKTFIVDLKPSQKYWQPERDLFKFMNMLKIDMESLAQILATKSEYEEHIDGSFIKLLETIRPLVNLDFQEVKVPYKPIDYANEANYHTVRELGKMYDCKFEAKTLSGYLIREALYKSDAETVWSITRDAELPLKDIQCITKDLQKHLSKFLKEEAGIILSDIVLKAVDGLSTREAHSYDDVKLLYKTEQAILDVTDEYRELHGGSLSDILSNVEDLLKTPKADEIIEALNARDLSLKRSSNGVRTLNTTHIRKLDI
ncbi:MAG: hypothetical protein FWF23_02700 [Alphaproteobacteria bacterium]|nr:hypothetical protein [Alphaproteobacteria bacterium]MCL2504753.1 hypothetical protein [Alphaproteobacteria bacterium]